jgi:hypothetical protein
MRRRHIASTIAVALALQLGLPAGAGAGGIPVAKGVPGTIGADPAGVTAPGNPDRFIQLSAGRGTVIARVEQDGGALIRSATFRERLSIPAVAYDGSPGGLSADGRTLVLLPSPTSARKTTLAILDAERLRVRDRVTLRGAFSFDAISPDGTRIYLIEYPSRTNPNRYVVRAYDVPSGRLLPDPIVDPNEPPGEMRGTASTRVTSPDGRWAYTLYDGPEYPFIHALDTSEGRAACVDLEPPADYKGAYRLDLGMSSDGSELMVSNRNRGPMALVDTQTFEVSDPSEEDGRTGVPWVLVSLGAAAGLAAGALAHVLHRRRVAPGGAR